ncbi:MAG: hypothetical protein K9I97_06800, partial [Cryomorphaceae bacterium]|nr:hypothetical protein [Cryomorphaceae bacterium]
MNLITLEFFAQNNVGIGTLNPDASSLLDLTAFDKGILIPRMTTFQRNTISNPATSLLVYDTDFNCFFYFKPVQGWVDLCATAAININNAVVQNDSLFISLSNGTIINAGHVAGPSGAQGPIGLTGPAGPSGAQGPIGLTGPAGPQGAQGPIGLTGPAGPQGAQGPIGLTGPAGPQGAQGLIGLTGPAGPSGAQGSIGLTGPAGPPGAQGPIGLTGPAGPQGAQGPIGLTGPSGPQGAQGPIGLMGPAGPPGAQGPIGLTGPAGPPGAQGPIGLTGSTGQQGPQGQIGNNGIGISNITYNNGNLIITLTNGNTNTFNISNAVTQGCVQVGDYYAGGIVFYVDSTCQHGKVITPFDLMNFSFNSEQADAISVCDNIKANGYTDWYLPNITELQQDYDN